MIAAKRIYIFGVVSIALIFTLGFALGAQQAYANEVESSTIMSTKGIQQATSTQKSVPVYWLVHKSKGENLYTTDRNEVNKLSKGNWFNRGIVWYAPTTGQKVYRLYCKKLNDHHYTADTNEVKTLVKRGTWKMDNGGRPMFYSGGSERLYRMNSDIRNNAKMPGTHRFAVTADQASTLIKQGWKQDGVKMYGVKIVQPQKATIENTSSWATIEADVKLTGTGTGHHAKLVMVTPTAGVSFGLQFDRHAKAPYTNKTMLMIENVISGTKQLYSWPSGYVATKNRSYHLMLALNRDGTGNVYLDGEKLGSFNNPSLKNAVIALRVEGAGRKKGDTVNATFTNIKLKNNGVYIPGKTWGYYDQWDKTDKKQSCPTIKTKVFTGTTVVTGGTVTGITAAQDWDSAPSQVSRPVQFTG